ncbi:MULTISPECIES: response regulator [Rufibacter]|uniref:CheY-like chemotaxis protein n=1 Tax=Rufibacter quisquiliarum TaxID=1549639 RepID=A0A839H0L8_9BACT|nr:MULTISPECIES: response regulator [Rufibacter]MBA9079461.1 CheY-like chemotaxis protein [Rufibacter quisquiliarum]
MKNKQTHILLVEDNPLDVANILRAFKAQGIENPVHVAGTGKDALSMLLGTGNTNALVPTPKIILLDLNLPGMGGLDFLKALRQEESLKACSVFVMTASDTTKDVVEAYDLNVAGYLVKPIQYESLLEMISVLNSFWDLIELPN